MNNSNLPPGVSASDDHIQGGDPRFDAEAERLALALGDQLDALYDDHQEDIIELATNHLLTRLDEEARGPDVLDLTGMDDDHIARIRAALDEWKSDENRMVVMVTVDARMADEVPRVLRFLDENQNGEAAICIADQGVKEMRDALNLIDGRLCGLYAGPGAPDPDVVTALFTLFRSLGMAPPVLGRTDEGA